MKKDYAARLEEISATDRELWQMGRVFAGIDEAGRGPLAGPVAAACVVMPPEPLLLYVDDSKKVTEKRREMLYDQIMETAVYARVVLASPEEIDRYNILNATKHAMFSCRTEKSIQPLDICLFFPFKLHNALFVQFISACFYRAGKPLQSHILHLMGLAHPHIPKARIPISHQVLCREPAHVVIVDGYDAARKSPYISAQTNYRKRTVFKRAVIVKFPVREEQYARHSHTHHHLQLSAFRLRL